MVLLMTNYTDKKPKLSPQQPAKVVSLSYYYYCMTKLEHKEVPFSMKQFYTSNLNSFKIFNSLCKKKKKFSI